MRTLPSAVTTMLENGTGDLRTLLLIEAKSANIAVWDGVGDLSWDGNTYVADNPVLAVGKLEQNEAGDFAPLPVAIHTSDPSLLSTFLAADEIQNRTATLYDAWWDTSTGDVVPDPTSATIREVWRGSYSPVTRRLTFQLLHPLTRALRRNVTVRAHQPHKDYADEVHGVSGDEFFISVNSIPRTRIGWPGPALVPKRRLS
jgi:hypothetical protein